MIEIVAEHKAARLVLHPGDLFDASAVDVVLAIHCVFISIGLLHVIVLAILLVRDGVFSCLLVQLAFHQDVEEHGDCGQICHLAVDVDCPEEWMGVRIFHVREADKVDCHVAEDILFIESPTDGLTDLGQVNLGETRLRRESTCVDKLCA